MKVKVWTLDGDTQFFDIVAGVLQGYTLASYLFIICQDYILWTLTDIIKENGFTLEKVRRGDILQKLQWIQTMQMA